VSQQVEPRAPMLGNIRSPSWPGMVLERLAATHWERWLTTAAVLVLIALAAARPTALAQVVEAGSILGLAARAEALRVGHPEQAAALWLQLRSRRPADLDFQERVAGELFRLYQAARAETEMTALLRDPDIAAMLRRGAPSLASAVGLALLRSGQAEAAVNVLRPALDRAADPELHQFLSLRLAAALSAAGRAAEAEPLLVGLLDRAPRDPDLRNALAYHYAVTDTRLAEAERLIQPALRQHAWRLSERLLAPHRHRATSAEYLDTLAWIRYRQNRLEEAKSLLQQAVALEGDEPEASILYHLAQTCYDLGDDRQAWDFCRKALTADPTHSDALRLKGLLEGEGHKQIG